MGKHTFHGFATSWDLIHQDGSPLLDHNLRQNSKPTSTPPAPDKVPGVRPAPKRPAK